MKNYREIKFELGRIESALKELANNDDLVCGLFNGQMLYSDIDDLDSAYVKLTGKTKAEYDDARKKQNPEYDDQKFQ